MRIPTDTGFRDVIGDEPMPLMWKWLVLRRDGGCVMAGISPCDGELLGHHTITQQQLRKRGLSEHAWDVRDGAAVCYRHHRRHHSRHEPILVSRLPADNLAFAAEHELGWLIDRYYTKEAEAA